MVAFMYWYHPARPGIVTISQLLIQRGALSIWLHAFQARQVGITER